MKWIMFCLIFLITAGSLKAQDSTQDYVVSIKNDITRGILTETFFGGFKFTAGDKK